MKSLFKSFLNPYNSNKFFSSSNQSFFIVNNLGSNPVSHWNNFYHRTLSFLTFTAIMSVNNISVSASESKSNNNASNYNNDNLNLKVRVSNNRGHADHGWLNGYHTFSFASYYDAEYPSFGCLRVINEDRVTPTNGFPLHPHRNFDIYSYVINGEISHTDSTGSKETLKRGEIQLTSAGSGVQHSEYNAHKKNLLHFWQIWVQPKLLNTKPRYTTKYFDDTEKQGKLRLIVSPDGAHDSMVIGNDILMYSSLLNNAEEVHHTIKPNRLTYIQVAMDVTGFKTEANETGITVNGKKLNGGDGIFITLKDNSRGSELVIKGSLKSDDKRAEFILFDIADDKSNNNDSDDNDD